MTRHLAAVAALLALSLPAAAEDVPAGGAHHPTCAETAERVLKPFLDRIESALLAQREYAEDNAAHMAKLADRIETLLATEETFEAKRRKEDESNADHVRWAEEAAREIVAEGNARLAEFDAEIDARTAEDPDARGLAGLRARRDALAAKIASREETKYKKELGFTSSIRGFEQYAADVTRRRAERNREYADGTVSVYHTSLRASCSRQRIDELLFDTRQELDRARMRELSYYLTPLRATFSGEAIDAYLAQREAELADARARIADGTFRLWVNVLKHTTDRNAVQASIDERRAALADVRAAWGEKRYRAWNSKCKSSITNGGIEERIAAAVEDHPDRPEKAAYWREVLEVHRRAWQEDIAEREEALATTWTWALGETPCGGGGGGASTTRHVVEGHLDFLRRHSETEAERRCREARYLDRVFVTPDGVVLGRPKDGLANALSDLPVGTGGGAGADADEKTWSEAIEFLGTNLHDTAAAAKDWGDLAELTGHGDAFRKLVLAQRRLGAFLKKAQALRHGAGKLAEQSVALAAEFQDLPEVLDDAIFSRDRIARALKGMRQATGEAKALRRHLLAADKSLKTLQRLKFTSRLRHLLAGLHTVDLANDASRWKALHTTVKGVGSEILDDLKGSRVSQAFFLMGLVKAWGETTQRMEAGADWKEAIGRGFTDLVVDLAIGGVPLTAAAEMVSVLAMNAMAAATGDDVYKQLTLSEMTKWFSQRALDGWGWVWAKAGEATAPGDAAAALEEGVDEADLRAALDRVEARLAAATPGADETERLLRMRARFRELLRAKEGIDCP
ncbi:MAG: hypothetical protein ACF8XB_14555 [Planctomycetota bacterium JB042]